MLTPDKQNLCIVASEHYTWNDALNIKGRIWDILDVRLRVLRAVAQTMREGCFFADGFDAQAADCFNDILDYLDLGGLRQKIMEYLHYTSAPLSMPNYEHLRVAEVFHQLRHQKLADFVYAKTEDKPPKQLYHELGIIPLLPGQSEPAPFDPNRPIGYPIPPEVHAMRDENMVRSVIEKGAKNNILFVGARHQMKAVENSGLFHFRINVENLLDGGVAVHGKIPSQYWALLSEIGERTYTMREIVFACEPLD